MAQWDKFRAKLLGKQADQNIEFATLRNYLIHLGFDEDINASHHIYGMTGISEIIVIQPRRDGKAKAYQVKQVRKIIEDYGL